MSEGGQSSGNQPLGQRDKSTGDLLALPVDTESLQADTKDAMNRFGEKVAPILKGTAPEPLPPSALNQHAPQTIDQRILAQQRMAQEKKTSKPDIWGRYPESAPFKVIVGDEGRNRS